MQRLQAEILCLQHLGNTGVQSHAGLQQEVQQNKQRADAAVYAQVGLEEELRRVQAEVLRLQHLGTDTGVCGVPSHATLQQEVQALRLESVKNAVEINGLLQRNRILESNGLVTTAQLSTRTDT